MAGAGSSKTAPTSTSKAMTATCRGQSVVPSTAPGRHDNAPSLTQVRPSLSVGGGHAMSLQAIPGSCSYTSIMTRGFAPSSQGSAPVPERAIKFGVTTPPAITRVVGGRTPPVLVQTVAPSTTTGTITSAVSTSTQGGKTSQNPIDCWPLGAKRPHLTTPKKTVDTSAEVIALDYEPVPIPVLTLDGDDSDPNKLTIDDAQPQERSPLAVPEKRARVGASPAMAKGVAAAGADIGLAVVQQSQAEAAAQAYANRTVGSVSPSSEGPDSSSAAPEDAPKTTQKCKSKKKRDSAKSQPVVVSSSDNDDGDNITDEGHRSNVEGLRNSLKRTITVESIHVKVRNDDFDFIKLLRKKYGLPAPIMTQDDISHFIPYVTQYRADKMKDPLLRQNHIWTIDEAIEAMNSNLSEPKTPENEGARIQWKKARRQLNELKTTLPMPESHECKSVLPCVYAKYVTRVFVRGDGKALPTNAKMTGDEYKRVVLGLSKLHKNKAISHRQEKNVDGGSICAFCCLLFSNHESVNNHLRVHWRMALMCALCSRVEVDAHEMIKHGRDKHGLQVP